MGRLENRSIYPVRSPCIRSMQPMLMLMQMLGNLSFFQHNRTMRLNREACTRARARNAFAIRVARPAHFSSG